MKKLIFMVAAVALFAFYSCSKDKDGNPTPDPESIARVKSLTNQNGSTVYSYDASGRCIKSVNTDGSGREYEYLNGIIKERYFDPGGAVKYTYTYELNGEGLVTKATSTLNADIETLQYNVQRQVEKATLLTNGNIFTRQYFYSKGNRDSIRYVSNGNWYYTEYLTYYPDKLNHLDYANFGKTFWGTKGKNLLKTDQNFFSDGTSTTIEEVSYEFDGKGRVTKEIFLKDGDQYINLYAY